MATDIKRRRGYTHLSGRHQVTIPVDIVTTQGWRPGPGVPGGAARTATWCWSRRRTSWSGGSGCLRPSATGSVGCTSPDTSTSCATNGADRHRRQHHRGDPRLSDILRQVAIEASRGCRDAGRSSQPRPWRNRSSVFIVVGMPTRRAGSLMVGIEVDRLAMAVARPPLQGARTRAARAAVRRCADPGPGPCPGARTGARRRPAIGKRVGPTLA